MRWLCLDLGLGLDSDLYLGLGLDLDLRGRGWRARWYLENWGGCNLRVVNVLH